MLSAQGFRAVSKTGRAKNSARHRSSNRLWLIAPVLSRGVGYVSMNGCKPDTCTLYILRHTKATAQNRRDTRQSQSKPAARRAFRPTIVSLNTAY